MPAKKSTRIEVSGATAAEEIQGTIEMITREGARKLLQAALEAEVNEHISRYEYLKDENDHQAVVRNGVMSHIELTDFRTLFGIAKSVDISEVEKGPLLRRGPVVREFR